MGIVDAWQLDSLFLSFLRLKYPWGIAQGSDSVANFMKSPTRLLNTSAVLCAIFSSCGFSTAATTLSGDYSIVSSSSGPTAEQGNLTVAGDARVGGGIDLGSTGGSSPLSALQLSYHASGTLEKSATFDLTEAGGSFVWRDNFIGAPSNLERTKMTLDENNVLSVYDASGIEAGITLSGSDGRITLNGANSGIYSGGDPVFSLDENGNIVFGADRSFSIPNTTGSTSSLTGALIVSGGIGAGMDSHFNGVRIGTGGSNISSNTAVGSQALAANGSGDHNTAVGYDSLRWNTTGFRNVAIGSGALLYNTQGSSNQAIGVHALASNNTGSGNNAMGSAALYANTTGSNNTAIGQNALLANIIGDSNDAFGAGALLRNTSGSDNVAIGSFSLLNNTSGGSNAAVGQSAIWANTTGTHNSAIGKQSLARNTTGGGNVGLGVLAGQFNSSGNDNVMIGNNAGGLQANAEGLSDPEGSVYIGANSRGYSNSDQNSIVIGADAVGAGANTTVIGNGSTTKARIFGTLDSKKVEITADAPGNDALVVDGRTRLKGQVILDEPQGDISMGIYE